MTSTTRIILALTAFSIAACSNNNEIPPISLAPTAPVMTAATTTSTSTPPTTSIADPTTVPASSEAATTVAVVALSGPMFSDTLGIKVDTAPGINTRGDTRRLLTEGLYVHIAWEADPNDHSVFTVFPDDIEILEAYANAVTAYYRAAMTTRSTDSPEFEEFLIDAEAMFGPAFAEARNSGHVLDLGAGVVLRPYVIGDRRTDSAAVVYDCYLQDDSYVLSGEDKAGGDLLPKGQIVTLAKVDGRWKVDGASAGGSACL